MSSSIKEKLLAVKRSSKKDKGKVLTELKKFLQKVITAPNKEQQQAYAEVLRSKASN